MNLTIPASFALFFAFALHQPAQPVAKFEWSASYEGALRDAAAEKRVVFVALDLAGEGRCENFLKVLAKDKAVVALAQRTLNVPAAIEAHKKSGACPRFKGLECDDHRRSEASLRDSVLQANELGTVAVPQYLWLDGEGRVLLSVPYEIEREGLIWCFETAQRLLDPEGAGGGVLSEEARPPRRLLMGSAFRPTTGDKLGRGMTAEETKSALAEAKKSFFGMGNRAGIISLMFTEHPDAVEYMKVELSGLLRTFARGRVPATVRGIGLLSPASHWEVLEGFEETDDPEVRREVAAAYEQLGASKALRLVKKAYKREKDERVVRAWVRALAASGPTDKGVRKTMLGLVEAEESIELRCSAAFAMGYLQRHADVRASWYALIGGEVEDLQIAAACGAALARDESCVPVLEAAIERAEGDHKAALERALAVLSGGDLYPLAGDVARVTSDDLQRARVFFGVVPEGMDDER